jgi:hypothetical protein
MSTEMDAGVGALRTPSSAADREAETEAAEPKPAEGWPMIFATLIGVLAASTIGVWILLA